MEDNKVEEVKRIFLSMSEDMCNVLFRNFSKVYEEASGDEIMLDLMIKTIDKSSIDLKSLKDSLDGMHVECSTVQ